MALPRKPNWKKPTLRRHKLHPEFWPEEKETRELCKWYTIVRDPDGTFQGRFGIYDFLLSFAGLIWTEGSEVRDHDGERYQLTYKPLPMMLRNDGARVHTSRPSVDYDREGAAIL